MGQILSSWNKLTPQRQIVAVLAVIAMMVTIVSLGRLATEPKMALLYSGLDRTTASQIVASLEQKAIPFEVRGDAIYADASMRDEARMALAGEGLPSNGPAGYELLDTLSGFGTTTQMFDAAYWRAKEGELARTILASAQIQMARVHIANTVSRPFDRSTKSSASVTVSGRGGAVSATQAEAIRHLVAAAVSGLAPEQVAVIDSEYGMILEPGEAAALSGNTGDLDGRADELRANVERLLTARVGAGNAIVEVMVETTSVSETFTERVIDPDGVVAISSDTENTTESSTGAAGGGVTVASNLPDTEGGEGGGGNTSNQTQTRERINYEISETVREQVRLPGDIARLSVAVLLNGEVNEVNGQEVYTPRSAEEIIAFQALVQSAVGFNEARGDVVTIETMQFPTPVEQGTVATAGILSGFIINVPLMLQMLLLGVVTIVLGMFVVRPILTNPAPELAQLPNGSLGNLEGDYNTIDASAVSANGTNANGTRSAIEDKTRDPVEILRETIAQRSEESSHLLRNWIEADTKEPTT